ncbi:MAG: glycosyltransferase family 2 protein [candidate division KSB1 bacterium]|nr:glycosyltransferase family 2 protein [candidate division KSB1 bacterium]MDZ7275886.1 glycosyltransferase family 2 protein [candidate division KSB1 bacterium]MDZ7287636.1 glycosyltransferase family 2 protein [candidate division KSB1 bacterium]MDZ7306798.1 glycosyltransferase family 2 protein [candidate division KSB1 bacterium]MDZ7350614.1 glycosyltransferase family 2 protein [candidate division KSB1 bacterium]
MTTLSIIVPAYNEANTIREILARVQRVELRHLGIQPEIIVVNDGSQDGTGEILEQLAASGSFTLVHQRRNRGKAAAVQAGLAQASGELILIQDADLEYDPRDYAALLAPVLAGRAEVVYGSRILGARVFGTRDYSSLPFYWGGRLLSWLTNVLFGSRLTDQSTGYKLFTRRVLARVLPLEHAGFEFCAEVTARLARCGCAIHEVPVHYYPRSRAEGKKITWRHGLRALLTLLRYRFRPPAKLAQDRELLSGSQAGRRA